MAHGSIFRGCTNGGRIADVKALMEETSRSTRGRKAQRAKAARFRWIVSASPRVGPFLRMVAKSTSHHRSETLVADDSSGSMALPFAWDVANAFLQVQGCGHVLDMYQVGVHTSNTCNYHLWGKPIHFPKRSLVP